MSLQPTETTKFNDIHQGSANIDRDISRCYIIIRCVAPKVLYKNTQTTLQYFGISGQELWQLLYTNLFTYAHINNIYSSTTYTADNVNEIKQYGICILCQNTIITHDKAIWKHKCPKIFMIDMTWTALIAEVYWLRL